MLYAVENAYKTFMAGFTTIQSPGAEMDKDLRDWINEGRVPGPRILTSLRAVTDQTGDSGADSRVHSTRRSTTTAPTS